MLYQVQPDICEQIHVLRWAFVHVPKSVLCETCHQVPDTLLYFQLLVRFLFCLANNTENKFFNKKHINKQTNTLLLFLLLMWFLF
jgi:hypothetical protein